MRVALCWVGGESFLFYGFRSVCVLRGWQIFESRSSPVRLLNQKMPHATQGSPDSLLRNRHNSWVQKYARRAISHYIMRILRSRQSKHARTTTQLGFCVAAVLSEHAKYDEKYNIRCKQNLIEPSWSGYRVWCVSRISSIHRGSVIVHGELAILIRVYQNIHAHIQMLTQAAAAAYIEIEYNQRKLNMTWLPAWLSHRDFRRSPVAQQASLALCLQGAR